MDTPTKTPLDIVQEVYQTFAAGNFQRFLNLCSADIEWCVNGPTQLEKCQTFYGKEGVQNFLDILAVTWQFHLFMPRQFIQDGSTVVVLGEESGCDRQSDIPFQNRWVHVFDVQEHSIVRFREFLCHWTGDQNPPPMSW
jgi:hypothetical protein